MIDDLNRSMGGKANADASELLRQRNTLRALLELPLLTAASRLANGGDFDRSALREELHRVCAVAKGSGVRAEQIVIAVKEIWASLPEARVVARTAHDKPFLSHVVSVTLDEYFGDCNGIS